MLHARTIGTTDSEIFNCNKALLLLALDQPEQANELLSSLHTSRLRDRVAAYAAVSLGRMGRLPEANAILNQAEQLLGSTDILRATRAHIVTGKAFNAAASTATENDPVPRIKAALWDFYQMDHFMQAEVLVSPPEPFDELLIGHVRGAAEYVTSLVPMMKIIKLGSSEDDLSALIRAFLTARVQFLGWNVPDQSKGGFSAAGNAGERDWWCRRTARR